MTTHFFHHESENDAVDLAAMKQVELSDEQLKHVSGGYIIAGPQGQLDWLRRQWYYHTHPGTLEPLVTTN